jgi:hypothetical protein
MTTVFVLDQSETVEERRVYFIRLLSDVLWEPPGADTHARWCWGLGEKIPRLPDWSPSLLVLLAPVDNPGGEVIKYLKVLALFVLCCQPRKTDFKAFFVG